MQRVRAARTLVVSAVVGLIRWAVGGASWDAVRESIVIALGALLSIVVAAVVIFLTTPEPVLAILAGLFAFVAALLGWKIAAAAGWVEMPTRVPATVGGSPQVAPSPIPKQPASEPVALTRTLRNDGSFVVGHRGVLWHVTRRNGGYDAEGPYCPTDKATLSVAGLLGGIMRNPTDMTEVGGFMTTLRCPVCEKPYPMSMGPFDKFTMAELRREVAFKLKADDEATSRREVQAMEDNKPRRSITGLSVSVRTGKGEPTPHFTGGFVCAHCGSQHGAIAGVRPADEPLKCPTCGHVVTPDAQ